MFFLKINWIYAVQSSINPPRHKTEIECLMHVQFTSCVHGGLLLVKFL